MKHLPIYELVDDLPEHNMTTRLLGALDWVVPGAWKNIVGFEKTITEVTGEMEQEWMQKIGVRAIQLYNDERQGYQRAQWLHQTIDSAQAIAGAAALVDKIVGSLSGFADGIDGKLDYVATFVDMATDYFAHTGTQTVARSLISRAASEV